MKDQDKQDRLAAALRENLRKRKGVGASKPVAPAEAGASGENSKTS